MRIMSYYEFPACLSRAQDWRTKVQICKANNHIANASKNRRFVGKNRISEIDFKSLGRILRSASIRKTGDSSKNLVQRTNSGPMERYRVYTGGDSKGDGRDRAISKVGGQGRRPRRIQALTTGSIPEHDNKDISWPSKSVLEHSK